MGEKVDALYDINNSTQSFSNNTFSDLLSGEWGKVNEFGVSIGIGLLRAWLATSYTNMIELYALENLLRLTGWNFEQITACEEVYNLLYQLRVRILADEANIQAISFENTQILIQFTPNWPRDRIGDFGPDVRLSKRGMWFLYSSNSSWKDRLIEILKELRQLNQKSLPSSLVERENV